MKSQRPLNIGRHSFFHAHEIHNTMPTTRSTTQELKTGPHRKVSHQNEWLAQNEHNVGPHKKTLMKKLMVKRENLVIYQGMTQHRLWYSGHLLIC